MEKLDRSHSALWDMTEANDRSHSGNPELHRNDEGGRLRDTMVFPRMLAIFE